MSFPTINAMQFMDPEALNLQRSMGEELDNAFKRVTNKYEPKRLESNIGLNDAQSGIINARLPYAGGIARNEFEKSSMDNQMQAAMQQIIMEALSGAGANMQQTNQPMAHDGMSDDQHPIMQQQLLQPQYQPESAMSGNNKLMQMMQDPIMGQLLAKSLGIQAPDIRNTGHAKDIESLNRLLNDPNIPPELKKQAQDLFDTELRSKEALINNRESVDRLRNFNALPADDKANLMAGYRALGLDEIEALDKIKEGKSPGEVAIEMGYSPDQAKEIDKQFAPTSSTRTNIQSTEGAAAEDSVLRRHVTNATKKFSRKFYGISPKLIAAGLKNDPKSIDEYAQFMAGRALGPEMALLQIRMAGGSTAHKAIAEIMERTGSNARTFDTQMSPEIYEKMQGYIHDWLQEAVDARTRAMKGMRSGDKADASDMITIRNPRTGETKKVSRKEFESRKKD